MDVLTAFAAALAASVVLPRAQPWLWCLSKLPEILLRLGSCSLCLGFWLGTVTGLVVLGASPWVLAAGFLVSLGSHTAGLVLTLLEEAATSLRLHNSERL